MERIPVEKLFVPQGLLPRVITGTLEEKVQEYVELLKGGVEFEPILVWKRSEDEYWVVDGVHRLTAHRRAGLSTVPVRFVDVKDEVEYRLLAIQANSKHGLPLKREEKQILAQTLYRLGVELKRIAGALGVTERTVYNWTKTVREEEEQEFREHVRKLMQEGRGFREVAREVGVSPATVSRIVKEEEEKLSVDEFLELSQEEMENVLSDRTGSEFLKFLEEAGQRVDLFAGEHPYEKKLKELLLDMKRELGEELAKSICEKVLREVFSNGE